MSTAFTIHRPKPTEVLSDLPIDYPRTLVARTFVIIGEGVRKFPVQTQTLELCKYVIAELTPLFREALRDKVFRQDQALSRMHDLLHYLLVHNCGEGERYEFQKEVLKSDEWLALAREMARQIDGDAPLNAGSNHQVPGVPESLALAVPNRLPEDQAAETNDLSLTVCTVCGHYGAHHDQAGCFVDPNGRSSKDPGILSRSALKKTGALCWCPKFVEDFSQAADLIYESGNCEALKHGAAEAISRGDSHNAHRLLDQFIVKTPPETRDSDWVRATERSIVRLQSVTNPIKTEGARADSLADQEQVSPQLSGGETGTWDTIEISFLSEHRVQIRNGATTETRNYAEFGFGDRRDRRSGKPNLAWKTFLVLAAERGTIRDAAKTGRTWPKVEKRIQEIRKVLRNHFRISADPIPFVEGTGYRARFKISCSPSFDT